MALSITSTDYAPTPGKRRIEAVLDSDADAAELPTDVAPGSVAIVADSTGHIYMVNASGAWKPFGWEGGGGND